MKLRLRLATLVCLCGILSLPSLAADVSLEVQPASIVVSSSSFTAEARVVLRNSGKETLRKVTLSQFSNDGIKVEVEKSSPSNVAAKQDMVWPVKISGPGNAHFPGSVIFEATYVSASGKQHLYIPLALQTEATQKPVEASIDGTLDAVSQQRPGAVYLLVTNNLDVPMDVSVDHKVAQTAIVVSPVTPFQVQARSTVSTKIDVTTASRVTPGVYPILLGVNAKWDWAGRKEERHMTLSKPATIGVFFESELLKALGVPSFLVLPGCLMVFAFEFLLSFNLMGLKDYSKLPDLGVSSPGFWILSISLSALFAFGYYAVLKVNYLQSYGVDDLRNVWVSSIPFGFLAYYGIARYSLMWRNAHVPNSSDSPITILQKLASNDLGIVLPRVSLGDAALFGFVIERIEDGKTMLWIAPRIIATWQAGATAQQRAALQTEMDGNRRPAEIATILHAAAANVNVSWDTNGVVPNPYHAKVDALSHRRAAELIVTVV
jgi:hypothetical protein